MNELGSLVFNYVLSLMFSYTIKPVQTYAERHAHDYGTFLTSTVLSSSHLSENVVLTSKA